ncbi:hypothetical protein ASPVEDRAFT_40493 [Aspergillus versicolor CBS 583.65]|uniref:Uncharacterized protein n=1 Tax=Aspergillus versicolor CBS 583.65 TaxID=1036611 RepID=A0A1L9PHG5_ASPVE|nr:uncharacterized protein ASPVEDRAFT_40493 [Aspergillus versicolor CBS 583.65]OJJ00974.1 hypothetical protein ASPVEDRAFT_40493 [Aspergillus versicolor CBS 583.65]
MQKAHISNIMLALTILDGPALLPASHNSLGFPRDSEPDRELALCLIFNLLVKR